MQTSDQQKYGTPPSANAGKERVLALDGLRGIAMLEVITSHLLAGNTTRLPLPVAFFLKLGMGVDISFVLSGFLITSILLGSVGKRNYFSRFYARRALRILPLYYGVLLTIILFTVPLGIAWNGVQWSLLLHLQNTHLFFPALTEFHTRYVTLDHLWSLAVEEQFYLAWPLAVLCVRSERRLLQLCFAGMALSLCLRAACLHAGFGYDWVNRNTLCRADELLTGAAVVLLLRNGMAAQVQRVAKIALPWATAAVLLLRVYGWWADGRPQPHLQAELTSISYTVTLVFAATLLLGCLRPSSWLRRLFEWRCFRLVGKYSLGLYLFHLMLLPGVTLLVLPAMRQATGGVMLPHLVVALVDFGLNCGLSYLSYHLYEQPFIRLRRFMEPGSGTGNAARAHRPTLVARISAAAGLPAHADR